MDNAKNNSPATNQADQDLQKQLAALLSDVKKINSEINKNSKENNETLGNIKQNINETTQKIEKTFDDLNVIEKTTNNKLDDFILKQAEDLATTDLNDE